MRIFLLLICTVFVVNSFGSEEMNRVDAMVKDIQKLRKHYEKKLFDEKEKNIILELENKENEKKIFKLQKEIVQLREQKVYKQIVRKKSCPNDNIFPKLQLQNEKKVHLQKIEYFTPGAFRLNKDSAIFSDLNGSHKIDSWEKGRSFTSNQRTTNMVKITGYFVNKIWTKAEKSMWIRASDILQREKH